MGKTTLLINLYRRYKRRYCLNANRPIHLLPLSHKSVMEKIAEIENRKNTVLLLDAFDEDPKAVKDHEARIVEIAEATEEFHKVIITCRTHFFSKDTEEPNQTNIMRYGGDKGYHEFEKLYLSPFSEKEIRRYLGRKYGWRWKKRKAANRVVNLTPNLMARPMLLAYMDGLISHKEPLN